MSETDKLIVSEDYPNESTDASMVLVLGETGAGKSYFVKKLTSNPLVEVGHNLTSCPLFGSLDNFFPG
jgi:hypothetical protein